jgi:hypothetical protein
MVHPSYVGKYLHPNLASTDLPEKLTYLEQLQKYLKVKLEQFRGAVAALSMLSHEGGSTLYEVDISSSPASAQRHR